jgi:uncharacterized protein
VIYLDSAALVKLVRVEAESQALVDWLNEQAGQRFVASALVEVEVPRALRRSQPDVLGAVAATLARIDRIEIDAAVRATAAAYVDPHLRSLDAVHLATADQLVASGKTIAAFITYDTRLAAAAEAVGLVVVAPGAST